MVRLDHIRWCFVLIFLVGAEMIYGCGSRQEEKSIPKVVIVNETKMHQKPDLLSPEVATLSYGQQVLALPKSPSVLRDWTEVRLDDDRFGFVKGSVLGTSETMKVLQVLKQSIAGTEPQASGVTTIATYLRLEPGRHGKAVEKLPAGTRFEMYQRQATFPERPANVFDFRPVRKEVWYKVRLADNRVGFIYTKNFKLEPPDEISKYAKFRKPMAWLKLRTVTEADFGSASDYIVAYATPDVDFGADFDRIEIYSWDGERYQTVFFASSLRGILPIRVIHEEEQIYFEFTELDPDHKKQVQVHRYPYAYPYKKIGSTTMQWDVGLH